jgi:hypothetical protein
VIALLLPRITSRGMNTLLKSAPDCDEIENYLPPVAAAAPMMSVRVANAARMGSV